MCARCVIHERVYVVHTPTERCGTTNTSCFTLRDKLWRCFNANVYSMEQHATDVHGTPPAKHELRIDIPKSAERTTPKTSTPTQGGAAASCALFDTGATNVSCSDAWTFNAWAHTDKELTQHAMTLLVRFGVHTALQVNTDVLQQLVRRVRSAYAFDNAYHNWRHAVDVLHTTCTLWEHVYGCAVDSDASTTNNHSVFCAGVLLSALTHDAGHPGVSLALAKAVGRVLAPTKYDAASLEHHHFALAWGCVNGDVSVGTPALHNLRGQSVRQLRDVMETCVLGTNMHMHTTHVRRLCELRESMNTRHSPLGTRYHSEHNIVARWEMALGRGDSPCKTSYQCEPHTAYMRRTMSWTCDELTSALEDVHVPHALRQHSAHRLNIWAALVHAADLGAQTRPQAVAFLWGDAVVDEFQEQVRLERDHGLPVTRFMVADTLHERLQCQVGYIRSVALPLWEMVHDVIRPPRTPLDALRSNLRALELLTAHVSRSPSSVDDVHTMVDAHARVCTMDPVDETVV